MKMKDKITVVVISPYLERPLRNLEDVMAERANQTGRRVFAAAQAPKSNDIWRGTWTRWLDAS